MLSFLVQKKRKQRMLGGLESDEDESDKDEEESHRQQKKKRREISGDDLGENFVVEDEYQEKGWVDEVLARKDDSDEEEDEEGGEDDEDGEGSSDGSEEDDEAGSEEGSDGEDGSQGSEDWEQSEDELGSIEGIRKLSAIDQDLLDKLLAAKKGPKPEKEIKNLLEKESKMPQKAKEPLSEVHELDDALPYVIDAPQTLLEFRQLVDKRSIKDLKIAVERIRKCNAISLAAENRKKMQVKLANSMRLPPCSKTSHLSFGSRFAVENR